MKTNTFAWITYYGYGSLAPTIYTEVYKALFNKDCFLKAGQSIIKSQRIV